MSTSEVTFLPRLNSLEEELERWDNATKGSLVGVLVGRDTVYVVIIFFSARNSQRGFPKYFDLPLLHGFTPVELSLNQ